MLAMCLRNLARRKFRTLLTLVGVVSGTCAVILMIAVGLGMQKSTNESLAQMGDLTRIDIYNFGSGRSSLNNDRLKEIMDLEHVVTGTPYYNPQYLKGLLYAGRNDRYNADIYNIMGIYPEALEILGVELLEGTWEDAFKEPFSLVSGEKYAYSFRDSRRRTNPTVSYWKLDRNGNAPDPYFNIMGQQMRLVLQSDDGTDPVGNKERSFDIHVSAVMKENWNVGYQTSEGGYMSVEDIMKMEEEYMKAYKIKKPKTYGSFDQAVVKVDSIDHVEEVENAIKEMGYDTWSMESIRKPMQEQAQSIQMFLGLIAGVSLFVAALGIINTMLMSVYERTREIGVMKVVGCRVSDIRLSFLVEAGIIGLMGGILGAILSCGIAWAANRFGFTVNLGASQWIGGEANSQMFLITPWLIGLALVFSTFIGVLAGFAPANRAVSIPALTAIREN